MIGGDIKLLADTGIKTFVPTQLKIFFGGFQSFTLEDELLAGKRGGIAYQLIVEELRQVQIHAEPIIPAVIAVFAAGISPQHSDLYIAIRQGILESSIRSIFKLNLLAAIIIGQLAQIFGCRSAIL